ncbi:MAG: hypothetical protein Fur006_68770 [Coleofasciculaceae cyanobacterium]
MDYRDIITIEPGKRSGKPCIRGMRITVYDILEYLASGMTQEEILEDFSELTSEDIKACLDLEEKRQLQEMIEQQIFEAEEALYEDDPETQVEIQAVRTEYAAGDYLTIDEYLASRSGQSS